MAEQKSSKNNILVQGSILAVASIISRIVGLLYRVPLTAIIGKTGNDYYGTAYSVYSILLIISSYSIPLAVSKLVSERTARGEYANAGRVLKGSMLFALISGGAAGLIVWFFSDFFCDALKTPLAAIALRVLAPVLLTAAIVGVLRGFFQGMRTMIPTAVSQIIEQIVNAVVSVAAAYYLFSYGTKVGGILGNSADYGSAYGAAGGTLGTAAGSVAALLFMFFIWMLYRRYFKKRIRHDRTGAREEYGRLMRLLVLTIVPVILSTTLYNVTPLIENYIFKNIAVAQEYSTRRISEWWGIYNGEFVVLQNVPMSIASALASTSVPALAASYASGNSTDLKSQIHSAQRFIMAIAIPCAVGMFVLAQPVMQLMFGDTDPVSGRIMMIGALSVPFFSLSTLSSGILQGIDKIRIPVRNALITMFAHVALLLVLLLVFRMNIYAVVISNVFYGFMMAFLNNLYVVRYSHVHQDVRSTYLLPLLASLVMGVCVWGAYKVLFLLTGRNAVATIASILVGILVYFAASLKTGALTERELLKLPKGTKLVEIAKKCHLL